MACSRVEKVYLFFVLFMMMAALQTVQGQICKFHLYSADCRYPIDGVAMAHITATVNYCRDPIDVSVRVESQNPTISWAYTFANDNEIQIIPGYDISVQMEVMLRIVEDKKLWIKADFDVQGRRRTYFFDEKVALTNVESCLQLNKAGQIAVGCLVTLLIIAGILLVILVVIKRRRQLEEQQNNCIIQHMEQNEHSDTIPPDLQETHDSNSYNPASSAAVVRFSLPTIPEQAESSSDSGRVSIDLTNGNAPHVLNSGTLSGEVMT